jgi:hypothetical protein
VQPRHLFIVTTSGNAALLHHRPSRRSITTTTNFDAASLRHHHVHWRPQLSIGATIQFQQRACSFPPRFAGLRPCSSRRLERRRPRPSIGCLDSIRIDSITSIRRRSGSSIANSAPPRRHVLDVTNTAARGGTMLRLDRRRSHRSINTINSMRC